MKPYRRYHPGLYIPVLFIFLAVHPLHSQSDPEHTIIGSWLFDAEPSFNKLGRETNDLVEANPEIRSRIRSAYVGKTITFSPDGSYQQVLGNGKMASGKCSIVENSILIATMEGTVFHFGLEVMEDRLLLKSVAVDQGYRSLMPDQYFTKIN